MSARLQVCLNRTQLSRARSDDQPRLAMRLVARFDGFSPAQTSLRFPTSVSTVTVCARGCWLRCRLFKSLRDHDKHWVAVTARGAHLATTGCSGETVLLGRYDAGRLRHQIRCPMLRCHKRLPPLHGHLKYYQGLDEWQLLHKRRGVDDFSARSFFSIWYRLAEGVHSMTSRRHCRLLASATCRQHY